MKACRQPLVDDGLRQPIKEGDVGAWVGLEEVRRVVAEVDAAGVDDDQLRPALIDGAPQPRRNHGVVRAGVGADHHEAAGVVVVLVGVAGGAGAELLQHRLHRR
jgi:hypothetical protein